MRNGTQHIRAVLLAAAALVACQEEPPTAVGGAELVPSFASVRPGPDPFPDEQYLRDLSDDSPGFAGIYVEDERLVVLALSEAVDAVRTALQPRLGELRQGLSGVEGAVLDVRPATYSFRELEAWRNLVFYDLSDEVPGFVGLDLDEMYNVVAVGIESREYSLAARSALEANGIPSGALRIDVVGRPTPQVDVDEYYRPIMGGLGVQTMLPDTSTWGNCSIGFLGLYGSVEVIATASHCSEEETGLMWDYGTAMSEMYQAWVPGVAQSTDAEHVATEYLDPSGWSCGGGWTCRRTDVALYEVDDSTDFDYGEIARIVTSGGVPFGFSTGDGPKVIDTINGPLEITAQATVTYPGTTIYKLGRNTGLTSGKHTTTCYSYEAYDAGGTKLKITCGSKANFHGANGDSGGTVFKWDGTSSTATLWGVYYAHGISPDTFGYFSSMNSIGSDLSGTTLKTFDPPLRVVTQGASPMEPDVTCQWWPTVSGGVTPYTSYVWSGVLSGYGSLLYGSLEEGESGFLYVTVTDSESTSVKDSIWVEVDENAWGCEY